MSQTKSWYSVARGSGLQQGDLLPHFLISDVPEKYIVEEGGHLTTPPLNVDDYNVVVLTQSCDLVNNKTGKLLVCPYYTLEAFDRTLGQEIQNSPKAIRTYHENIRRGFMPAFHMLGASTKPGFESGICVVDFRLVSVASVEYAKGVARQARCHLRLKSPFVEHLSQAFGRYFMRVGLPSDIPSFT